MSEHENTFSITAPTARRATALVASTQDALDQLAEAAVAVDEFVDTWIGSGLTYELVPAYACTLTCAEAEALANLLHAFGHGKVAEAVRSDHAEHDECGDLHHEACPNCQDTDQ
ncbi:hypothetical protein [Streptomyces lasiicapitis]|uniref:Uncharacterized protein n=1 Tax=Streptomyces lasiicapitis TaxID=1923961 RepID=A0ABQ2MVB5_9ACTN|nr:hypothetical protein [Streptomyces lasiicapitis]GGO58797.1 hypothetical protein GCM10012286_78910 [Streptomyces lasiicapitis]